VNRFCAQPASQAVTTHDFAILGSPTELEVVRLSDSLSELDHPPLLIDTSEFPRRHALGFSDCGWQYDSVSLNRIKAFFLRSLHCNDWHKQDSGNGHKDGEPLRLQLRTLREKDSMLGSLLRWAVTHGKPVVNPLSTLLCHYYKLHTVDHLKQAGIPVPTTFAGSDSESVKGFIARHEQVICKPLAGGGEAVALTADDLSAEFLDRLSEAPVLLQERIHGTDVRAYVLGGQIIAAGALVTDRVDFRTGPQNFEPTPLSPEECLDLIKTARAMHLAFAGIDFKRTDAGRHVILDVNPAPMFAGFERLTGLDIAGPIARFLIEMVE